MNLHPVTNVDPKSRVDPAAVRSDMVLPVLKAVSEQKLTSITKVENTQKNESQMEHLLEQAEKMANVFGRNLKFRYRKEADVYQVEVIDTNSNEVVRKIPSDEMVRFIGRINEMLGALFDEKA